VIPSHRRLIFPSLQLHLRRHSPLSLELWTDPWLWPESSQVIQSYGSRAWSLAVLERVLAHRHSVIVHLNWVSIFLGFHAFGMYIHNDTLLALGRQSDQFGDTGIPFRPVIGLLGQALLGSEASVNGTTAYTGIRLTGTADLLVHHIHAFTIHVTALILIKGVLFARSSRLVIDKHVLGFRFPCDGPGRGGTCQVSAWDHVYLGLFWMYNCISVVIFGLSERRFLPHEWFLRAELDYD
jgi:photosystem I P700 chlorophyll a apoprotein A1